MKSGDVGVDRVRVTEYERALARQLGATVPTDMEQTFRGRVSLSLLRGLDATS